MSAYKSNLPAARMSDKTKNGNGKNGKSELDSVFKFVAAHWIFLIIFLVVIFLIYQGYKSGFFTCKNSQGQQVSICLSNIGKLIEDLGIGLAIIAILSAFLPFLKGLFRRLRKAQDEKEEEDANSGGGENNGGGGGGENDNDNDNNNDDNGE